MVDISIIGKNSIKVKGKEATFIVDPEKDMPKTAVDAVIILRASENIDPSRATESRITINGAGGYEVGGAKISGTTTSKGTLYRISIDGITVILGKASETKAEGFSSCQVLVVNADSDFNQSFVTALEPKITALYGENKNESAKALGAESVSSVSKLTVTKDKLPEKMEIVVLN